MKDDAPREHDATIGRLSTEQVEASYEEFAEPLRRFLTGVLADRAAAQDVVQSVFVKFAQQGDRVDPARRKAWLFQVGFRDALQWKRRQETGRRAARQLSWLRRQDRSERPEGPVLRAEEVERVRRALAELPAREREVVESRIYEGMTFAKIAERLDTPLGTVLGRMRSALARLRTILDED